MAHDRDIHPLSELQATADGLAPQLSAAVTGIYVTLLVVLALLMLAAFAIYL